MATIRLSSKVCATERKHARALPGRVWASSAASLEKQRAKEGKAKKITEEDEWKLDQWISAKRKRDYILADDIRNELREKGIEPGKLRSLARPKVKHDPEAHQVRLPSSVGVDIGALLEKWFAAKQAGDLSESGSIHSQLHALGVDPYSVWPDVEWSTREEPVVMKPTPVPIVTVAPIDLDPELANDVSNAADDADSPRDQDDADEQKASASEIALAAVVSREYFERISGGVNSPPMEQFHEVRFHSMLLSKLPASAQTCASLSVFFDRKLRTPLQTPPALNGPEDLLVKLEVHADLSGRHASLNSPEGWDLRAKRVLDIPVFATSEPGKIILQAAQQQLDVVASELDHELRLRGECSLEVLTCQRCRWAWENARRDWLVWCNRLNSARWAALVSGAEGSCDDSGSPVQLDGASVKQVDTGGKLDMIDIFKSLLAAEDKRVHVISGSAVAAAQAHDS